MSAFRSFYSAFKYILISYSLEVVLASFLRSFVFEPVENKEIVFNMGGVVWPCVAGGSGKPELPLKVSLVKGT